MSGVIWPWNTVALNSERFIVEPGPNAHEYVRCLVADRYGPNAEMVVDEVEVTGDEATITVLVCLPPGPAQINLRVVPVDLAHPGQQDRPA
jgi:hypothetical protein